MAEYNVSIQWLIFGGLVCAYIAIAVTIARVQPHRYELGEPCAVGDTMVKDGTIYLCSPIYQVKL